MLQILLVIEYLIESICSIGLRKLVFLIGAAVMKIIVLGDSSPYCVAALALIGSKKEEKCTSCMTWQ